MVGGVTSVAPLQGKGTNLVMSREQRRRLTDLYITGKTIAIDDGTTETDPDSGEEVSFEPITVYLRKLNPIDQETCLRRANAERSKVLSIRNKPESPEYEGFVNDCIGMTPTERIELIMAQEVVQFRSARESEIAAEEEWSNDRYLDGLLESWQNGLEVEYALDPENPEAKRVFEEMSRYQKIVDDLVDAEIESLRLGYERMEPEDLNEMVVEKLISFAADSAWLQEYRRSEIWLSVRESDDHKRRYFESREEVNDLSLEVMQRLVSEYAAMNVPATEGKDSAATQASSDSSEQPKQEEAVVTSGLLT
jgi:hypothetical protein